VEKPRDSFLLRGGYSSAWSADVNGEEKLKVENFFRREAMQKALTQRSQRTQSRE
jgi:hypothetical protein